MGNLVQDVRFALRMLRRNPAVTVIAVATLAFGLGANTAVFSVLDAVLLRPLPFPDGHRIVAVHDLLRNGSEVSASWPDFEEWRSTAASFEGMAAFRGQPADVTGGDEPERIGAVSVSRGFFRVFGVAPLLGQTFDQEVLPPGGLPPAVISEGFWRSRFGARRDVIGKTIRISGRPYVLAGVMPAAMDYPWKPEVWMPLDGLQKKASRSARNFHVVARLKGTVDLRAAQAELSTLVAAQAHLHGEKSVAGVVIRSLREELTSAVRATLWLLFALAGLVLLIACANTAMLLLSRERARAGEVAMRAALGATSGRIVQQLLTESALLALFGTVAGLMAAVLGGRVMLQYAPVRAAVGEKPLLSVSVLAFSAALLMVTTLLFGFAPALRLARTIDLGSLTRRAASHRGSSDLLRRYLVAAEVMLAVLLLVPAGLMIRSLLRLTGQPLGFEPRQMIVVNADVPRAARERWVGFYEQLLDRLGRLPGAAAIGASNELPVGREKSHGGIVIEGRPAPDEASWLPVSWQLVNEQYFAALRVPVIRGRGFQAVDRNGGKVAVISRAAEQRYWPQRDPIGTRITAPGLDSESYEHYRAGTNDWITIVGVAADVRSGGAAAEIVPEIYLPYFQHPSDPTNMTLAIRTPLPIAAMERPVKETVHALSATTPVKIITYQSIIDDRFAAARLRSALIRLFAILALVLVAGGVYGVTSYWVEQRRREIGIRLALGAEGRDVVMLFVRRGLSAALIGLAAGTIGAVWLTKIVEPLLYRVSPTDPVVFGIAVAIALINVLAATFLPARRAAAVPPADVLRTE